MEGFNTAVLNDRDLLLGGVVDLVAANAAGARCWQRLIEIHRRHQVAGAGEDGRSGWGPMTPREWTALEVSETWAMSDQHTRTQLNVALFLSEHLPGVWALCLSGALDRYRAVLVADLVRHRLDEAADWALVQAQVLRFLTKHLRRFPELGVEMVTCTVVQLRNRLNYVVRRLVNTDEEYARSYRDRSVQTFDPGEGISVLVVENSTDQVMLARHRLHLSAKALRNAGDPRTIDQLMSDLALDLIIGRAQGVPVPGYARPIINVTVPLETLAGLSDDPGQLCGGAVIPADLARAIATREGATWFRLLTDPEGGIR